MAPTQSLDQLQERFGIPRAVRFEQTPGGLVRAIVTARAAEAHLYLHGGHVTHYQPYGQEPVLFMSAKSLFGPGRAIRGGVPVIFPWFGARAGDPSTPAHGFARVSPFEVESVAQADERSIAIVLRLDANDAMRRVWPESFVVRYRVQVGLALDLALEVTNTGQDAFSYEEALHTYLAVADVQEARVTGLAAVTYIDKTDGMMRKLQGPGPIRLATETDRVYVDTRATCVLDDPRGGRRIVVDKQGSETTVIWNPWVAKAKALADFGDEEWRQMLCIETANAADNAVTLASGARHELRAVIRAEPLR